MVGSANLSHAVKKPRPEPQTPVIAAFTTDG
jgi:hypothetical protein